jgi:PhnB protein
MQGIVPYLTVKNAAEAIDFYKKSLGAEEISRAPTDDGRLMHADLSINGGTVYVMDEFSEHAHTSDCGSVTAPSPQKPSATSMVIQLKAPPEVDASYQRALDAGCVSVSKPEDTFWNARFAVVCDPYGHIWMFNAALPAKS